MANTLIEIAKEITSQHTGLTIAVTFVAGLIRIVETPQTEGIIVKLLSTTEPMPSILPIAWITEETITITSTPGSTNGQAYSLADPTSIQKAKQHITKRLQGK